MTLNAAEVRVGTTGHVYFAIPGTPLPTDVTTPLGAAFRELGYLETGPEKSVDTTKQLHTPWQAKTAVRQTVSEQQTKQVFTIWQRNGANLKTVNGGGTVVAGTNGATIYRPPADVATTTGVWVIETIDGSIIDRECLESGSATLGGSIATKKDGVTGYPLELVYLTPPSGDSPWVLVTNDPAVPVDA